MRDEFKSSLIYADTLSLTTYYPAPFGSYSLLKLTPTLDASMGACTTANNGVMYLSSNSNQIKICVNGAWVSSEAWTVDTVTKLAYLTNSDTDTAYKAGIGIAVPLARLHVKGIDDNTNGQLRIESTANDARISLYNASATATKKRADIMMSQTANSEGLRFLINNVDEMIVDENGNVGIGLTAPTAKLHVAAIPSAGTTSNPIVTLDNMSFLDENGVGFTSNAFCNGTNCSSTDTNFMGLRMYSNALLSLDNMTLGVPWAVGSNSTVSMNVGDKVQLIASRTAVTTDTSVNVGIGIAAPVYKLHVNGAIGGNLDSANPTFVGELKVDCKTSPGNCYAVYAP